MFSSFKKVIDEINEVKVKDVSVKCPVCGGKIIEEHEYWTCEKTKANKCNFEMKNTFKGKKLNISILAKHQKNTPKSTFFGR